MPAGTTAPARPKADGGTAAPRLAVVTFDEPEFEPSYVGTPNQGKSPFAWLFFTGRCQVSDLDLGVLKGAGPVKGAAYLMAGLAYAARSVFRPSETIFEVLREFDVPATFFGVFNLLDTPAGRTRYLPVYRRILAEGHELGLHGYRHGPLNEMDVVRSRRLAAEHLGIDLDIYSSPFGDDREETLALLARYGFRGMRVWHRELLDAESPVRRFAYDYRLDRIAAADQPIVVINLHSGDYYPWGARRVKGVLSALRDKGYRFVSFGTLCAENVPTDERIPR